MEDYIMHVGVGWDDNPPGVGSGRYPHGSGKNPNQHDDNLRTLVNKMRKDGISDLDIAKALIGDRATASDLKAYLTIERLREREANRQKAMALYEKTGSASEVARIMYGDPSKESSVRSLLDEAIAIKNQRYENTAEFLKEAIANSQSGVVDVGSGQELTLGVTKDTLNVAKKMLEEQGYTATWVTIPQANGKDLVVKVLADPNLSWKEIQQLKYNVDPLVAYSPDEGLTFQTAKPPVFIDGKRVYIRYDEQGGTAKDGTIELRPGVDDISLGGPLYAQVRIAVEGPNGEKGFMKGMAFYNDDIPEGYDIVYNTNKKEGTPAFAEDSNGSSVYKKLKPDEDNPFGATIKKNGQPNYIDKDGNEVQGVINKISEEGDWSDWSKNISSQFLSKQNINLINRQLELTVLDKEAELAGIMNLTNPVIKQKLLNDYAEQLDAQTVKLSAKAPSGSAFQVILPVTSLKDSEIYAPNYNNGDQVALIRYPHGGIFEIPILTVNNKNAEADKIITKNAKDAVGINQHNADILSGADFDGDTVIVIPMNKNGVKIINKERLDGLIEFDHKSLYKLPDSAPEVKDSVKQKQMGIVTNLINDMSVQGADWGEIERAVKHSMVVIDSVKHHLDMNASYKDNNIDELKAKYQGYNKSGKPGGGASTILSKASSTEYVNLRKEITDTKKMDEEQLKAYNAGKHVYVDSGKMTKGVKHITDPSKMTEDELKRYNDGKQVYRETGKVEPKQERVAKMRLTDDATTLVRDKDNPKEMAYANYANELKALANEARREARNLDLGKASVSAKETYKDEVASLDAKLRNAQRNAPKERQAQIIAKRVTNEKIKDDYNYEIDYEHRKKLEAQELERARAQVGAKKEMINISDREWEAIQAKAVSPTKLKSIINNTDQEKFKQRAMPSSRSTLSTRELNLIKSMKASGQYTNAEIAAKLNVSTTTVANALKS